MSLKLYEESSVKRIAEAIRKKTGASTKYKIGEMASAINEITGGASITVDAALSTTSENPVQNKAVKAELDKKLDKTGGTVTGSLTLKGAIFSDSGLSFGTGEHVHFTKAADDAAQLKHGSAGVDDMVPFARLKVATPTEDDDAATKAYVDEKNAGEGAVRYDAAQELTYAQKAQARRNMDATGTESPQFKGYVTLTPANGNDGTGVGLSVTGSDGNYVLDISDVNEGNPTLLNGVDTPTDAQTDSAANVAYVKAKIAAIEASGGVDVDDALSATSTNPVQNKAITAALTGKAGTAVATQSANGLMSKDDKTKLDGITGQVTADKVYNPDHVTDLVQYAAFQIASQQIISQIPTVLPSPNALTVTCGSNSVTYDGSADKIIDIPSVEKIVTETTQVLPAYTNLIPISTDASGAVLNGVGYEAGALHSDGSVASASSFTSGFIPVKKGDVVRIKDPSTASFSLDNAVALYKADKAVSAGIGKYIRGMQSSAAYGGLTIDGDVLTWDTSSINYYAWQDFKYLRVTTSSADSIVTVNEEIKESTQTVVSLKPTVKVSKGNLNFAVNEPLLAGKTVVCFGDSIFGMTRDTTSVPAWAAAFTGAKVYNVGFGGCRMAVHPTSGYAAFSMWALADAVATGTYTTQDAQASSGADYFAQQLAVLKGIDFGSVDTVVIHYGTNDFTGNVAIDNATDDDDTSTLCGALRYALRKIQTAYPKIRVFISSPIYRKWDSTGAETYTNANGKKLREFCTALAGVADEFNCPCIDGYKALGINTANASAFLADGTHLNEHGRQAFGEYIGGCLISPKAKLDGVARGANKTVVDTALSDTSTNPVQNKAIKAYVDSKASGSGGGKFLITSSMDEELGDHVIDKTVDEVVAAYEAGQMIYLNNTNASTIVPLSAMYKIASKYTFIFDRISYSESGSTKTATLCRETLTGSTGGTLSTDYLSTGGTLGRFTLT